MKINNWLSGAVALASACFATSANAQGNKFEASADAFTKAVEGYVAAVDGQAKESRADARAAHLKQIIYAYLMRSDLASRPSLSVVDTAGGTQFDGFTLFLCAPRVGFSEIEGHETYLRNLSAGLQELTNSPPDKLIPLIYSLSKDYSTALGAQPPSNNDLPFDKTPVFSKCAEDIAIYPTAAYGPFDSDARLFGAILGLIDVIKSTIVPAAKAVLTQVDRARRNAAIKEFILDDKNREQMAASIAETNKFMERALAYENAKAVLKTKDAYFHLFEPANPAAEIDGCKPYLKVTRSDEDTLKQSREFQRCHAALTKAWGESMVAAVTAAGEYDAKADGQLAFSSAKLDQSIDYIHRVAKGQRLGEKETSEFIGGVLAIMAAAQKVETAMSDDNIDKIEEAVRKVFGQKPKKSEAAGAPS